LPLYTVFPKPLELDNTVQYLLNGPQDAGENIPLHRFRSGAVVQNPYSPVVSSAIFVAVVLGIGCLVSYRAEY